MNKDVNDDTGEIASDGRALRMGLSNAHIQGTGVLTWAIGGRLLVLRGVPSGDPPQGGGLRSGITTFSRQSRKRLMQAFASLDELAAVNLSLFITLTYHDSYPLDARGWYADLTSFLDRLEYHYPEAATIWRLDFQERGAPHYHLLTLNTPYIPKGKITSWWAEIAHSASPLAGRYATNVQRPCSWRHTCAYVSKYMAKASTMALPVSTGRWWGISRRGLLPRNIETLDITERTFYALKSLILDRIPADKLPPYVRFGGKGFWTMLPYEDAFELLRRALAAGTEHNDQDNERSAKLPT